MYFTQTYSFDQSRFTIAESRAIYGMGAVQRFDRRALLRNRLLPRSREAEWLDFDSRYRKAKNYLYLFPVSLLVELASKLLLDVICFGMNLTICFP